MPFSTNTESITFPDHDQKYIKEKQSHVLLPRQIGIYGKHSRKNGATETKNADYIDATLKLRTTQNTKPVEQPSIIWSSPKPVQEDMTVSTPKNRPASLNLELFSSTATDVSPSSTDTSGWADSVSTHNISPNNPTSLGGSPSSSSDESRKLNFDWMIREQRDIYPKFSSQSSPNTTRSPFKCQLDGTTSPEIQPSDISSYATRQSSKRSRGRRNLNHPLIHKTQDNLFGAYESNLMPTPQHLRQSLKDDNYHCGFDTLFDENVVIVGHKSGLDIFGISKRRLSRIYRLEGLRGGVYSAKIIPWSAEHPDSGLYPLIVLVIHGIANTVDEPLHKRVVSKDNSTNNLSTFEDPVRLSNNSTTVEYHQTTVELYSLSANRKHIVTLLSLPKIPTNNNLQQIATSPDGSLFILADCGNLVITSGTTGETWIYKLSAHDGFSNQPFQCVAKVWTSVQYSVGREIVQNKIDDWHSIESLSRDKLFDTTILSLNGHWLAYCPPSLSSQRCLGAVAMGISSTVKVPGLNTQAPPNLPEINCGTETPGQESMIKQIAQFGTQNLIKASNYLAHQGLQVWTNYRNNKPSNTSQRTPTITNSSAASIQAFKNEPSLISILDLDALVQNTPSAISLPNSLFTFRVPYGCSFLSFSPNGLSLFTASSKGDKQFVWDLMQAAHTKVSDQTGMNSQGPHVRQIAKFSRMTITRIVDVVWKCPYGERIAMVTEPGTIHILDLPASAFTWPPLPSKPLNQKVEDFAGEINNSPSITTSVASNAVNSLWTAARPLVSRRRRSSTSLSARDVTTKATHGTQVIAAGINRSMGVATEKMNEIRNSVGTKLYLPRNSAAQNRNSVILLDERRNDLVIALAGGIIRLYTVTNHEANVLSDKQKMLVKMIMEHTIPPSPPINRTVANINEANNYSVFMGNKESQIISSGQEPVHRSPPNGSIISLQSSIPNAEIEPNAPYQPFHIDKRVMLHTYRIQKYDMFDGGEELNFKDDNKTNHAWVFGAPITTTKIDVGPRSNFENELEETSESQAISCTAIESVMGISDDPAESEHIIITTRRRKAPDRSDKEIPHEYGFFEDDCEMLDFTNRRR